MERFGDSIRRAELVLAKVAKIEYYNERIKRFKQNQLFTIAQKFELNGQTQESNEVPDADQTEMQSGPKN